MKNIKVFFVFFFITHIGSILAASINLPKASLNQPQAFNVASLKICGAVQKRFAEQFKI